MIGTLRKHSQAMWWVIIVAIIITFVYWGSQSSRNDGSSGNGNFGSMNGRTITAPMMDATRREVLLYHYFATGAFPGGNRTIPGFDTERETYNRLFAVQKATDMGIIIAPDAVGKAASDRLRAINGGNPVPVAEFEKQVLARERLTLDDFERFVRNELVIQQLIAVVGMGGQLVPPQEIEALYKRDYQELAVQLALFHGASNLASVVVTPEKLSEFYTNQQTRYRLPERVQVSYVRFPISNYLAQAKLEVDQVTNLTELIEARMIELGTNYTSLGATPEAAKEKMRSDFFKGTLFKAAETAAKAFDNQLFELLYNQKKAITPVLFAETAKTAGLTAEVTLPFGRDDQPAGLDVGVNFVSKAFNLTAEEPLCEPLAGEDSVYVITLNRHLPSEPQTFEAVRARVTEDYKFIESAMKARQLGIEFQATATNGVAAGKSFADVCAQAKVKPLSLPPLAMSTRSVAEIENLIDLSTLKRAAFATAPGQVGPVLPTADGVAVVYVQSQLPLNQTAMQSNLPAFTRSVHQVRRGEVFNEWFRREAEQAFRTVPYFQQKQAQMQSAPQN